MLLELRHSIARAIAPGTVSCTSPLVRLCRLSRRSDLSKAPGLAHLRYALTTDSNYVWTEHAESDMRSLGEWAFRFARESRSELCVLFDEKILRDSGQTVAKTAPDRLKS